jgi:hypothetical protein
MGCKGSTAAAGIKKVNGKFVVDLEGAPLVIEQIK